MIIELFAGTKSFSKAASGKGFKTFTSDIDPAFITNLTKDILELSAKDLPRNPLMIWASPPCEGFSVASIGKHWNKDNTPKTEKAKNSVRMVEKTLELIKELKPKYWVIENPRGKLRKLAIMEGLHRHTVTYCQYGDIRMKPTDIWTNIPNWKPRAMCKNGDTCHVSAPRGSSTGTQGIKTDKDRSRVPGELCEEIINAII